MANISINELTQAIQRSGLPFGDPLAMRQALPMAKNRIAGEMQNDPRIGQAQGNYQNALKRIADADQRLNKIYSDPGSSMYIENPSTRERLRSSTENIGYRVANVEEKKVNQVRKDIEDNIDAAVDLYRQFVTVAETDAKARAKTTKSGSTSTSKSSSKQSEADKERKALGLTLSDQAGISDERAREVFLNAPSAFQKTFLRQILDMGQIPEGGFTERQIRQSIEEWATDFKYSQKANETALETLSAPPPKPLQGRDYIQSNLG